jgi:hypothetical protein
LERIIGEVPIQLFDTFMQQMSDSARILEWLNLRTGSLLKSIREAQSGREICQLLCDIADSPQSKGEIQRGGSVEERTANYNLVQSLLGLMHLEFPYDIEQLANLDKTEFIRLATDLMSLTEDDSHHDDVADTSTSETGADAEEIDNLIGELEANLEEKMQKMGEFQSEMNDYAVERDFYLSKLMKVEKACKGYSPDDALSVIQVLKLSSADFEPV